jgi:tetratricopeptide (TPR) repeat protein
LNNLGVIHREAGRLAEAETVSREALAIKEALAESFASVPQYRHELARSFNNLGALLVSANRPKDARTAFEKAVDHYERLGAGAGAVPLITVELAGTYTNLARLMGDNGQLEESLPSLKKSIEILEAAHLKDRRAIKVRESLLVARWARAMTLAGLRRFSPALEDWSRAIELDDGRYRNVLRQKRASNYLNLKDHGRAAADAVAVAESSEATGENLYNAACVYAICARIAAGDAAIAESYADRAVIVLRRAAAKDSKNLARINQDSDLDALRARGDFKQLLHDLEQQPIGSASEKKKPVKPPS